MFPPQTFSSMPAASTAANRILLAGRAAARSEQTRNERRAERRGEHLKQIGAVIGASLFILMCILVWAFFG